MLLDDPFDMIKSSPYQRTEIHGPYGPFAHLASLKLLDKNISFNNLLHLFMQLSPCEI